MTARPVSGKKKATKTTPQLRIKWAALRGIAFTTPANDGVGGKTNSMHY
jgi:hypothetical protein